MLNGQKEMVKDHAVSLLRCLECELTRLPETSYGFMDAVDREIATELVEVLERREELYETTVPAGESKVESTKAS